MNLDINIYTSNNSDKCIIEFESTIYDSCNNEYSKSITFTSTKSKLKSKCFSDIIYAYDKSISIANITIDGNTEYDDFDIYQDGKLFMRLSNYYGKNFLNNLDSEISNL